MSNNPSIYVPRVHNSLDWKMMKQTFEEIFGEGTIARVDIVKIRVDEGRRPPNFNRAYVHFKKWPEDKNHVKDKLLAGESCKIVYDEPNYWLCLLNKADKKSFHKSSPRLVLDEVRAPPTLNDHIGFDMEDDEPHYTPSAAALKAMENVKRTDRVSDWADGDVEENGSDS